MSGAERDALGEAARIEEELRHRLEQERGRSAAFEREARATRESTAFRFGVAVALAGRQLVRVRPGRAGAAALRRALVARLAKRGEVPAERPSGPRRPRPTVLFVAWGAGPEELERLVAQVARLHAILIGFDPVFLVDSPAFAPLRRHGYAFEYVMPLADWRRTRPAHEWGVHVTDRVAEIAAQHEPSRVVVLETSGGPSALEQGVLDALILPSIGASDANLLGAGDDEAGFDSPAQVAIELLDELGAESAR